MKNLPTIDSFRGEYGFLSNFYPAWVMFEGKRYPTAEHAYQAAKSLNPEVRNAVAKCSTPGEAKKFGRKIPLRNDWEKVKIPIMRSILQDKFLRHVELGKALKATVGQRLVEGNNWNDTFWGECRGKGENHLGRLLMETRAILTGTAVMQWQGTQAEIQDIRSHAGIKHIQPTRRHARHLAFDTETYPIIDGLLAPRVVCLTYCFDDGSAGILLREDAVAFLHEQLDSGHVLVGHNVAYDFTCMAALDPDLIPKIYKAYDEGRAKDTYVREKLIMLAQGQLADAGESGAKRAVKFGLDAIVQRRFNRDISADKKGEDAWRVRYNRLDGVPLSQWPEKALNYAIDDAKWTLAVFEAQEAEVAGDVADSYTQTQAAFWLHLQGVWGVRTHPGRVNALRERIQGEFDDINAKMRKWGILKAKMVKGQEKWSKDMKKVRELVVKAYGGEANAPTTNKGDISTTRATLMEAPHPHRPECTHDAEEDEWRCHDECLVGVLHALGRRSAVEKLLSTFLPALLQGTQFPINPRWNELVATGRTSAMNPNLQQPPRKGGVRECFVPRPGYYYIGADYSFIELCALAQVCLDLYGESALAEAINAGLDPHLDMAAYLMGIPYEEAVAIKADKSHSRHGEVKEKRQLSKCFHPDTEVLTRAGWKKICDLVEGEEVIAADPQVGGEVRLVWQIPTKLWSREFEGELVHLHNEGMDLRVTPDHRMLAFGYNCKKKQIAAPKVVEPGKMTKARYWANTGKSEEGTTEVDERLLRLAVATQADGSYPQGGRQIHFGFSKQRKVDRLLSLLRPGEYRVGRTSQGATEIAILRDLADLVRGILDGKSLPWSWLDLTPALREVVVEEAQHWDAHQGSKWRMYQYFSTDRQSVDVLQALASLQGRKTRSAIDVRDNPNHKDSIKLSVKDHHLTRGGNLQADRIPYAGEVVCLTVPTSYVLVRDGGIPVIAGQCLNFGLPGGLGARTFVDYARATFGVIVTEQQSRELKPIWQRKWPEMVRFHADIGNRCRFGQSFALEQLRSHRIRGGCGFCDGSNSYFQGLAADGAKRAGWLISKECYLEDPYRDGSGPTALHGSRQVLFLHDEFILESPREGAPAAADRLAEVMILGMKQVIPDVDVFADPVLMDRWWKGAETVRDETGKLTLWQPGM